MRLVSYNILDGGEGRADPLAEVIEAQRADIVVLVEADHPEVNERIARRLKMDLVHAPGNARAVAILTRWTIVDSINHAPLRGELSRCLLETTIRSPRGAEWSICALHLYPQSRESGERKRERELDEVLEVTRACRERRGATHLVAGDFNASSPIQKIDPERYKPSTREQWEENGGGVPRRVIERMLKEGYIDTLHANRGEYAATHGTFSTQFPEQRIDYIFAHGIDPRRIASAWIERDRLAKYASDHFPVGVEIAE